VLRYLAGDQKPDKPALVRAAELLKHVDAGQPRPVETHLLRTMEKQIPLPRDPDLIRLALAVQVEAERTAWFVGSDNAYPYAEQVSRWFGKRLEALDKQRRDSTDLVFAGEAKSGTEARAGLEQVRKSYGDLGRDAAALGTAFRLRDRVLARLPYYARWAAGRRVSADEAGPTLGRVKLTAEKVHELVHALETPESAGLARIQNLVQDLDGTDDRPGQFRALETEFKIHLTTLRGGEAVPSNWHAIDNALAVPFIPTPTRVELLIKLRSISRLLNDASEPGERVKSAPVNPREMAQRQGQMAMAVLGERQGTELPSPSKLTWKEVRKRVDEPDLGPWWESIAEAGEWIGAAFTALPRESARLADHGARGDSSVSERELTQSARYARLMDGATVLTGGNPVAMEQRFWTHNLLIAMAERAAADGWADLVSATTQTYSLLAANSYLDSAESILLDGQTSIEPSERERRLAAVKAARGRLKELAFDLNVRDTLTLTDQSSETLGYRVTPRGGATGYPVLRLRSVSPPLESKEYPVNEYRAVSGFSAPKDGAKDDTFNLVVTGAASGPKGEVVLDLLYRGRVDSHTVHALYEGTPTYRWIYHPPTGQNGSFAIKGDEALRNGAVAFLVDVSLSMNDKTGENRTRYLDALDGLRTVLGNLPEGTIVSVSVFAGDKITGVDPVFKPDRWRQPKAQAQDIYKLLLERKPDGPWTPLATSIKEALLEKQVFPSDEFKGFRNLVVITDGSDTVIDPPKQPPTSRPGKTVVDALLKAQKAQDIGLHLVLFGLSDKEYADARIQFDVIEEPSHYEAAGRTPAQIHPKRVSGKAERAVQALELSEVLKEAMLPRASIRGKETAGHLPVSIAADRYWAWLDPPVKPETYQLSALESRQALQLEPADRVLLELKRGKDGIEIALPPYLHVRPDLPVGTRTTSANGIVHLTVPRNSLTPRASVYDLDLTATLEKPVYDRRHLHQERPMFAWFEVTPQAADRKPTSLRVENLLRRYAPAWSLTSANWPPEKGQSSVINAPALPRVEAYWLDTEPKATATREFTSLNVADRELTDNNRTFGVDDGQVMDLQLSVNNGYMTVRLTHTEGKPVVVRAYVQGLSQVWTLGEDHKFFGKANRYTATFGPLNPDDLPKRLTLKFFSIASVKAMATTVTVDVREAPDRNAKDYLPEVKLSKE
jgi:hypothetical protein